MGKCLFMRKGEIHTKPKQGLPSGYTKLAYIQSSGSESVDTLFSPKGTTRVVLDAMVLSTQTTEGHLCSVVDSSSGPFFTLYYDASAYGTRYGTGSAQKISGVTGNGVRRVFDKNKNVTTIDGTYSLTETAETFTCAKTLPLFCRKPGAGGTDAYIKMRLYSCQIYDNGTLVRDFVPCINESGEVGLYDLVGRKFYGNAGTGAFTGSEVA